MNILYVASGILAGALLLYLFFALMRPEKFE